MALETNVNFNQKVEDISREVQLIDPLKSFTKGIKAEDTDTSKNKYIDKKDAYFARALMWSKKN